MLKAELIRLGWPSVRTHDLQAPANELQTRKSDLFVPARPLCAALAEVDFTARYPGFDLEEPVWPKFHHPLDAVTQLAARAKSRRVKPA